MKNILKVDENTESDEDDDESVRGKTRAAATIEKIIKSGFRIPQNSGR